MEIVGFVVMPHSPSCNLQPIEGPGKIYVYAVFRARHAAKAAGADVVAVLGPDHVRNFFFDLMPAFCIGVEEVTGFGDYSSPKGPLPTRPDLASHVATTVIADGFDPALSYRMASITVSPRPTARSRPICRCRSCRSWSARPARRYRAWPAVTRLAPASAGQSAASMAPVGRSGWVRAVFPIPLRQSPHPIPRSRVRCANM